jgi:hypothetical protein
MGRMMSNISIERTRQNWQLFSNVRQRSGEGT